MNVYEIITSRIIEKLEAEQRPGVSPGQAEKCRAT